VFYVVEHVQHGGLAIDFEVYDNSQHQGEYFSWSLHFAEENSKTGHSTNLEGKTASMKYSAVGIPDSLFLLVAEKHSLRIESAVADQEDDWDNNPNDKRTKDATIMWDRLVSKNIATYDDARDIYYIDKRNPSATQDNLTESGA
jgi:hypothetical protein